MTSESPFSHAEVTYGRPKSLQVMMVDIKYNRERWINHEQSTQVKKIDGREEMRLM